MRELSISLFYVHRFPQACITHKPINFTNFMPNLINSPVWKFLKMVTITINGSYIIVTITFWRNRHSTCMWHWNSLLYLQYLKLSFYEESLNTWHTIINGIINSLPFWISEVDLGYLFFLPSKNIGVFLDNNVFRISLALRLGCEMFSPHKCICWWLVDKTGIRRLRCIKSAGTFYRHYNLNHISILRTALNWLSHLWT